MADPDSDPKEQQAAASASALADLMQALQRLDALLVRAIEAANIIYGADAVQDPYRGLYISAGQVSRMIDRQPGQPGLQVEIQKQPSARPPAARPVRFSWLGRLFGVGAPPVSEQSQAGVPREVPSAPIKGRDTREAEPVLPLVKTSAQGSTLQRLQHEYGLTPFDLDILLVTLAPEIDLRYERLYAYLQDDVTRRRPSVDLVLNLLCMTTEEKAARRAHFAAEAPLIHHGLLHLLPDRDDPQPPLLAQFCQLDPQVTAYLLGTRQLDPRLIPFATLIEPQADLASSPLPPQIQRGLAQLIKDSWDSALPLRLYFQGPPGSGRLATAEGLAREANVLLLAVDVGRLLALDRWLEWAPRLLLREALLLNALLYLDQFDMLRADEYALARQRFWDQILADPGVTIFSGAQPWVPINHKPAGVVQITFPLPDPDRRVVLWQKEIEGYGIEVDESDLRTVSGRFRLTQTQIAEAAAIAANLARLRSGIAGPDTAEVKITRDELFTAARIQTGHALAQLARKVEPKYEWNDLKLPEDSLDQLEEIVQRVEQRELVMDGLGFGEKHARSQGITVLFAGPSGTGKTMAAEVLSRRLGLDLYKIDLSTIVSKYIGETEKNLEGVFRAAQSSNAILFFDEADALFGKRTEVRDSHDRYANIEVSYLLQKMEEYNGVAILATNLRQNLDEAFVRRLAFTVSFPYPDDQKRQEIWAGIWPEKANPKLPEEEMAMLSSQFRLAGGNIKNIALSAAYLASGEGSEVQVRHILRATRREYQKMGKAMTDKDLIGTRRGIDLSARRKGDEP